MLHTARLALRPFADGDVDPLHRILSEEGVLAYFPNPSPPARDGVARLISAQGAHWAEHGYGWWAVALRQAEEAGALLGWCGLGYLPETNEVEISYLLGKTSWGHGYATEAAQASVRFGFEVTAADEIVGIVHPENAASRRVIEKLGMCFTRRAVYFGMDCERYALPRGEKGTPR
jgi:ribosomal-protein-alanine N-acetyltransferase